MDANFFCEALISAAISLLLEKIASPVVLNYFRRNKDTNSEDPLKTLKIMVSSLTAVLDDAEERQIRDDPKVKAWLDEVEEAVLDADDLFDEIETDALRREVESQFGGGTSEVRETKRLKIFDLFSKFRSSNNGELENKMKEILNRLEEIVKQKDKLCFKESFVEKKAWKRTPSTSVVEESKVYGRDAEKEVLIKLLLSDDSGKEKICVIPVVGMGGIGKTTLTQAVFNDEEVREHFQLKAWVCVSEEYDALRVTRAILKSVSQLPCDDMDLNSLQVKLRETLAGKKFLIILDDVWNEDKGDWWTLKTPFEDGAQGSKIIVSTRSDIVANVIRTVGSHQVDRLTDGACWQLFAREASAIEDFTANPELEKIGQEIVRKCKGLPLAVKILGGLLRSTSNVQEWERISKSDIWDLTEKDILPALRLSYHYLPSHLKRCFCYCSIFPKDYLFKKEELILLWMAENLLQDLKSNNKMEDVGNYYFNELVSRSFFQSRNNNGQSFFVMHDCLVDLAKYVSKNCLLLETSSRSEPIMMKHARHLCISYMDAPYEKFNSAFIFEATGLRTFLKLDGSHCTLSKNALDNFLKLGCLRVLSFDGFINIKKLPDSIGDLWHLRYLNISNTSISCLPETIIKLYNLQTIKLVNCHLLSKLPKDFHHLISLRYFDISDTRIEELPESMSLMSNLKIVLLSKYVGRSHHRDTCKLQRMPTQLSKLNNLQRLSTFVVGEDEGTKIGELGTLSNLRGTLHIKNLQNVVNPEDALEAKLNEKRYLTKLIFCWERNSDTQVIDTSIHEKHVLDNLVPYPNLEALEIDSYRGTGFPNWLGNPSFCNIVDIHLSNCKNCTTLPPLGQLSSLKMLSIVKLNAVVTIGLEFYGSVVKPFASLEDLKFKDMRRWKDWSMPDKDVEAFPKLEALVLKFCNNLEGDLPCFLPSLTKFEVLHCPLLASPLPKIPKVTKLTLINCSENIIRSTEALDSFSCLQDLEIEITGDSFSMQFMCLPKTLRSLSLGGCRNLQSLWVSSNCQLFETLVTLEIDNCPSSTLFPSNITKLPRLTFLTLRNWTKLKFLPEQMHNIFPSLEYFHIKNCLELESFPASRFSSTLLELHIVRCDKLLASRRKWNLQTLLPNLKGFYIIGSECEDMESFPEEGLLPTTLTHLMIYDIECVERLNGKGLQQLKALLTLDIVYCKNLQMLPEEGLPSSLDYLSIDNCPLVEEKCERETGEYWKIISHIPYILINHRRI